MIDPTAPCSDRAALGQPIYLDYQATTPMDPRVLEAMLPYFTARFGNPHARSHGYGWKAEEAVEQARKQIAALICADEREIIFTSGATESNNLAILGAARFQGGKAVRRHVVTVATEHKCVLEACRHLESEGFRVTYLPVGANGLVDLGRLADAVTPETLLVSVMAVNNEIGVIQPIAEIGRLCRAQGALFHSDAAQAFGKIPLDVEAMRVDLMSVTGHKVYGPQGIGALYVRRRPRARLAPLFHGGGQERGLRSGTLPLPLCVGFGAAAAIAAQEMAAETQRLVGLRDRFLKILAERLGSVHVNGDLVQRIPGNLNLCFAGIDGEVLMRDLEDLAISSGSACTSAALEPSYVLRALGLDAEQAHGSLRIGFGRFTSEAEMDYAAARIGDAVSKLRRAGADGDQVEPGRPVATERLASGG